MIRLALALCMAAGLTAQAGEAPFTGRFLGTGRACYGMLAVRTQTISWLTTFSQCQAPHKLVEHTDSDGHLRITWRFTRIIPGCRYELISLTHDGGPNQDIGWSVTGYGSEQSYLNDKRAGYKAATPDTMSCYLVREADQKPR
ncbi:hypothetical protein SAMN05428959_109159 [Duganella sp. CF517]|nr:hypothetical protein SAMN05428959_109159 [Duganella sp. CF517]